MLAGCSPKEVNTVKNNGSSQQEKSEGIPKAENADKEALKPKKNLIIPEGKTIEERFALPEGFERVQVMPGSFEEFLRKRPLKPHGSKVLYFDGREKNNDGVYAAVMDYDIGKRDLHQCADAIMLLRAEYLFASKRFDDIHFNFVGGFKAEYSKWKQGWRIQVTGDNARWVKSAQPSDSYQCFRQFMDIVFAYAGTASLELELKTADKKDMKIGDVFIKGGSPGHAVIVVDMAENKSTGEKLFMLAQSYMPAQQTQILCNRISDDLSPWYSLNFEGRLSTPEWTFMENSLKRFQDNASK